MRFTFQALLKSPCPFCQDVWCTVKGTPRKREGVKCLSKGHMLYGAAAATRMTYKEIVYAVQHPNLPTVHKEALPPMNVKR
jgi:hypothetical protein